MLNNKIFFNNAKYILQFYIFLIFAFIFRPKALKATPLESLNKFKTSGVLHLPSFFHNNDISILKLKINNLLINFNKINDADLEKLPGNIKLKNVSNYCSEIRSNLNYQIFKYLSFIFCGWFKKPNIIYTVTNDGKENLDFCPGKCTKQIASNPHVDSYRHYLKILILLNDVSIENGPTQVVPCSMHSEFMRKKYNELVKDKSKTSIDLKTSQQLVNKYGLVSLTGKAGDVFIINTKNLHWAGEFNFGKREILWLYY